MASIESLLNPLPAASRFSLPSPSPTTATSSSSRPPAEKRQKMAKDAPVFHRGRVRGELRYPPCEDRDAELEKTHRQFRLHPMGNIADYPRHVPYNSDKKSFQEKTGRESFEVFQYTFQIPGEEKQWTVMWDYNIGLVRTTHLFKCNSYSKTTPGKMLNANPGLREICHSITGGAIAAQGYWMPFDAAKAISATFCWHIRYALTPLFGTEFPSLCVPPDDRARYGRMVIDPAVVRKATETADHYRSLELKERPSPSLPLSYGPSITPGLLRMDKLNQAAAGVDAKCKYRRITSEPQCRQYADSASSECGSASELADRYYISPVSPPRSSFTPINGPRISDRVPRSQVRSPKEIFASLTRISPKPAPPSISEEDESETDVSSSNLYSDLSCTPTECLSPDQNAEEEMDADRNERDGGSDAGGDDLREFRDGTPSDAKNDKYRGPSDNTSLSSSPSNECGGDSNQYSSSTQASKPKTSPSGTVITRSHARTQPSLFAREVKAAHALLRLHMQEATATAADIDDAGHGAIPGPLLGARSADGALRSRKRRRNSL